MTPSEAIPLDYTSTAIRLFLDRCVCPNLLEYPSLSFTSLHEHRKLINHLDCNRLSAHVQKAYSDMCMVKPFEVLLAASADDELRNVNLGFAQCAAVGVNVDTTNLYLLVSQFRKTWQLPLLKSLLAPDPPPRLGPRAQTAFVFNGTAPSAFPAPSPYPTPSTSTLKISWPTADRAAQVLKDVQKEEEERRAAL